MQQKFDDTRKYHQKGAVINMLSNAFRFLKLPAEIFLLLTALHILINV